MTGGLPPSRPTSYPLGSLDTITAAELASIDDAPLVEGDLRPLIPDGFQPDVVVRDGAGGRRGAG